MKRLAAILALLFLQGTACADRDIVFPAQWYRWAGFYRDLNGGKPERARSRRS